MRILCIERGGWPFFASVRGDLSRHAVRPRDPFFLEWCFCLGGFPGLLLGDGLVIGLSGCFRRPWIPLGISVENLFYEIECLDSRTGLIMGDSLADARGPTGANVSYPVVWLGCLAPRAGFEPATRSRTSRVSHG